MFGSNILFAGQISYCPGELAYLIVGSGGEAKFGHRVLEQHFTCRIELTEFLDLLVAHPGVRVNFAVTETLCLDGDGLSDFLTHRSRVELARSGSKLSETNRRDVDMNIDSVH